MRRLIPVGLYLLYLSSGGMHEPDLPAKFPIDRREIEVAAPFGVHLDDSGGDGAE